MTDQDFDCTVLTEKQQAAVAFREELLRRLYYVLGQIESRKVKLKDEYASTIQKETVAVVATAWTARPDYSKCVDPEVHRLLEEWRALTTTHDCIVSVQIPAAERRLQAERDYLNRLTEIDREHPLPVVKELVN